MVTKGKKIKILKEKNIKPKLRVARGPKVVSFYLSLTSKVDRATAFEMVTLLHSFYFLKIAISVVLKAKFS